MRFPFFGKRRTDAPDDNEPKFAYFLPGSQLPLPDPSWQVPELKSRLRDFLMQTPPAEIQPIPDDSVTDMLMRQFLAGGAIDLECVELLHICMLTAYEEVEKMQTEEAKDYFGESLNLLMGITLEVADRAALKRLGLRDSSLRSIDYT